MIVKFVVKYDVVDDFNWTYSYLAVVDGVEHHLCSVSNSENGPVGPENSIEAFTRTLIHRTRKSGMEMTACSASGNFTKEVEIEISSEEAERFTALR